MTKLFWEIRYYNKMQERIRKRKKSAVERQKKKIMNFSKDKSSTQASKSINHNKCGNKILIEWTKFHW